MSEPTIRAMTKADLPAIRALVGAAGLDIAGQLNAMAADYLDNNKGGKKNDASGERWLTCDDSGPVAVAYLAPEPMSAGTWNLRLIAVHPDKQGIGLGALLMQHIEQTLTAEQVRILLVEISSYDQFQRTRNFYRKIGYHEEARIREFYKAGEDKIMFRKDLFRG